MTNEVALNDSRIVSFLEGSVLEAYNESIKSYNNTRARECLGRFNRNGQLTEASALMSIQLANSGALPKGARLATKQDLKDAIQKDNKFFGFYEGVYTNFGLMLITAGDTYKPNDLLAKNLANQLKQRDIRLGSGKLIHSDAVYLSEEQNSAYGLVINLKEGAENSISDLDNWRHNIIWDFPIQGLSPDNVYSFITAHRQSLADSWHPGRVVVVRSEGTRKNLIYIKDD